MIGKLRCWKCGEANIWYHHPIDRHGDIIIIGVCLSCYEVNEFVNGEPVKIVIVPVTERAEKP